MKNIRTSNITSPTTPAYLHHGYQVLFSPRFLCHTDVRSCNDVNFFIRVYKFILVRAFVRANDLVFIVCIFIRATRIGQTTYEGRAVTFADVRTEHSRGHNLIHHPANRTRRCNDTSWDKWLLEYNIFIFSVVITSSPLQWSTECVDNTTINHGDIKKGKSMIC